MKTKNLKTMNDTILQDSIQSKAVDIAHKSGDLLNYNNVWFWVAIAEFSVICFLIIRNKRKKAKKIEDVISKKQKFKNEALKNEVDFGNIINSSFNSIQLYDELKVKCHPDRFPNDANKNEIANELFQEITKNKTNYKKLLELKEEAINKLNINF